MIIHILHIKQTIHLFTSQKLDYQRQNVESTSGLYFELNFYLFSLYHHHHHQSITVLLQLRLQRESCSNSWYQSLCEDRRLTSFVTQKKSSDDLHTLKLCVKLWIQKRNRYLRVIYISLFCFVYSMFCYSHSADIIFLF